jgi:hypothetical protein
MVLAGAPQLFFGADVTALTRKVNLVPADCGVIEQNSL